MLRHQKLVAQSAVALPLLLTTVASAMLVVAAHAPADTRPGHGLPAAIAHGTANAREGVLVMMSFMGLALLLIIPTMLPSITATHSIIGEKQARTLEPLLATPLRTWELLTAKLLACALPGIAAGWISASIYVGAVRAIAGPHVVGLILKPAWLLSIGLLGPLVAVLATMLSMIVSSRVSDVQSAQAASVIVVLPVVGFGISQMMGLVVVSAGSLLGLAATLAAVDIALLALCVSLFERETVLTRWK